MNWTHTLKPIWPTSYAPSPPIPKWFQDGLTGAGGLNPRGKPNYIVAWAMDLWDFCNGNPRSPKYLNPNNPQIGWACFVLERWVPAEFYDRTEWENLRVDNAGDDGKFIDRLGPYKNRGTYILAKPLMTDAYEPLELSQQLLEVLQWGIKQGPLTGEALQKHNAIQRKLKQAREAEVIDSQTAERREWFK